MIEVNLLPGGKKRKRGGPKLSFSLPSFGGGGGNMPDKFVLGAVAAVAIVLGAAGYTWFGLNGQIEEVQVALSGELEDSARFHDLLQRNNELTARRDSILQRIAVIQDIDEGRYVWAHILDELARALPDYTWLTGVTEISPFPAFELLIDGGAGDNTAVTMFMSQLEASPFFREIRIINSSLSVEGTEQYYAFQLQLYFEMPSDEYLETVPLFEGNDAGPVPGSSGAEDPAAGDGSDDSSAGEN